MADTGPIRGRSALHAGAGGVVERAARDGQRVPLSSTFDSEIGIERSGRICGGDAAPPAESVAVAAAGAAAGRLAVAEDGLVVPEQWLGVVDGHVHRAVPRVLGVDGQRRFLAGEAARLAAPEGEAQPGRGRVVGRPDVVAEVAETLLAAQRVA